MASKHRVIIVEDHTIVREGLRAMLDSDPALEVIGESQDGHASLKLIEKLSPDLVLMDLSMPKLNGIEAIRQAKRIRPETKIIVLTVNKSEQSILAAYDAGANGYVLKDATRKELMDAIKYVIKGNTYICPAISGKVIEGFLDGRKQIRPERTMDKLTSRERQIFKLIAEGHTSKEIAGLLAISVNTAMKHRSNLMRKLELHSIPDLVVFAMREGFIDK